MSMDPDIVRVDLLRVKRKLFMGYPEGSKERQEFVLATKLSELAYLQGLITPEKVDDILEEYITVVHTEAIHILFTLCVGSFLSILLLYFHQLHTLNLWFSLWYLPGLLGIGIISQHIYHLYLNWKKIQPFNKEYIILQGKIQKLLEEIKGLVK